MERAGKSFENLRRSGLESPPPEFHVRRGARTLACRVRTLANTCVELKTRRSHECERGTQRCVRHLFACIRGHSSYSNRQPHQVDESLCVLLIVLGAHGEARDIERVQRIRRFAADWLYIAL